MFIALWRDGRLVKLNWVVDYSLKCFACSMMVLNPRLTPKITRFAVVRMALALLTLLIEIGVVTLE